MPIPPSLRLFQLLSIMNPRMLWAATVALSALVSLSPGAWAQSSDVTSCPAGFEWNENSLKQDPCLIASMLDATCRSSSSYGIPPLHSGQSYAPPLANSTYDLVCDCDTVMYSLYMACSACQGGVTYSWIRWAAQCDTVYISQYPHDIPHGTAIPRWALYNVTTLPNQTFDGDLAITIGRDPEATSGPVSTMRSSSSTRRPSSSSPAPSRDPVSTPSPSPTLKGGSGKKNNNGAIIGGVIGGLVPLVIFAIIAAFYLGRRKRRERTEGMPNYYREHPGSPALTMTSTGHPWSTHQGHGYQGGVGGYTGSAEM